MLLNEELSLLLERGNSFRSEGNCALTFRGPAPGTVKCLRSHVGRKERHGIQAQLPGSGDDGPEVRTIRLLHGRTSSNLDLGPDLPQGAYATLEGFKCTVYTPNLIVNFGRAVERDNHIIHRLCNRRSLRFE